MCNSLGIPCLEIEGTSGKKRHTWNMVRMEDGRWYHADVLWDDASNRRSYDYFLTPSHKSYKVMFPSGYRKPESSRKAYAPRTNNPDGWKMPADYGNIDLATASFYEDGREVVTCTSYGQGFLKMYSGCTYCATSSMLSIFGRKAHPPELNGHVEAAAISRSPPATKS